MNIDNTTTLQTTEINSIPQQNRSSFEHRNALEQTLVPTPSNINVSDSLITDRIVKKLVDTYSLRNVLFDETLDELVCKGFLLEKTSSCGNRKHFTFTNNTTGKKIEADENNTTITLNEQILSQLRIIDEQILSRLRMIDEPNFTANASVASNKHSNLNKFTPKLKLWVSKIEKTITSLTNIFTNDSINRALARGFYVDIGSELGYTFRSRYGDSFTISSENTDALDVQLTAALSKIPTNNVTASVSCPPEEQIESYGYKLLIISKALVNLSNDDRTILMGDTNDPRVNNIELFKQIIIEAINNDILDYTRNSHLEFLNNIEWKLDEINIIIRKGILFLED